MNGQLNSTDRWKQVWYSLKRLPLFIRFWFAVLLAWNVVVGFAFVSTLTGILAVLAGLVSIIVQLFQSFNQMEVTKELSLYRLMFYVPLVSFISFQFAVGAPLSSFEYGFACGTLIIDGTSILFDAYLAFQYFWGDKHFYLDDDDRYIYSGLSDLSMDLHSENGI